ncbi:thioredoxin-disulfide reductase [uncultured Mailhella sp.]|uniref:thioredoxin-disulfide reductase n=1 Tax=uncultured Mailhella sp. TaxID=1981031 RepID=UPI0025CF1B53|nr:thioredoxin-disulfide reductase [uncultured Mailhella sp.]
MLYDAVVIGAGPAGLTAALYLVRSGVSVALVENAAPGGQILSTAEIENYPGFPKSIKGWELADLFDAHLAGYPVERVRGQVLSVEKAEGNIFRLALDEERELKAKTVVACTGAHHRKLGAPGEETFSGKGVSYCAVCDGNFYRGRDVAVVGGGNSALEEALYLSRIVNKVYLIHRRDAFRGAMVYQSKIREAANIELVTSSVVDEIRGGAAGVDSVAVRNVTNGESRVIPVEGVFIYVGMEPVSGYLPEGINRNAAGFVLTDAEMCTDIPGIFAAGDLRAKRCRQVSSAVGDGATAATAASSYLEQWHA